MVLRRRHLIHLALAAAAIGPAGAQDRELLVVGVLVNGTPGAPLTEATRRSLAASFAELGWEHGRNLELRFAYAEGRLERLPALAQHLAGTGVDVLLALGGPAARAATLATTSIPIVFSIVTDPVALGLVRSMDSPGGNATGITSLDPGQAAAQMKLLKEAAPHVRHVAILSDAGIPGADANGLAPIDRDNLDAASAVDLVASVVKLQGPRPDLDRSFEDLSQEGVDAIVALEVPVVLVHAARIARLAASRKMVSVFPGGTADVGAVLTYGTTVTDAWKRMPVIADRIARGTPASRIPVERVTRRELVVNLRAARALGLELPAVVTQRADTSID